MAKADGKLSVRDKTVEQRIFISMHNFVASFCAKSCLYRLDGSMLAGHVLQTCKSIRMRFKRKKTRFRKLFYGLQRGAALIRADVEKRPYR